MKSLSKDARNFVEGVTNYIRSDKHGKSVLPKVTSLFTKVTSAAKKERIASVTTVVTLSETEKTALRRVLTNILGHDVECRFALQSDLLGGMKIQVADWVVDTSVSSQLANLTKQLI